MTGLTTFFRRSPKPLELQSRRQRKRAELKRQLTFDKSAHPYEYDEIYKYMVGAGAPTLWGLGIIGLFNNDLLYLGVSEFAAMMTIWLMADKVTYLRRLKLGRASRVTEPTDLGELQVETLERKVV